MIKKSLFTLFTLFIVYEALLMTTIPVRTSWHQHQNNIIIGEKYLYSKDDSTCNNVIIGSSLSARINMNSLPDFYNLSFGGLSVFEGLNVLKHKETLPKNVFIETNIVLNEADVVLNEMSEGFNTTLFSPILFTLRKYVVSLREDKQPIYVMLGVIENITKLLTRKPADENLKQNINLSYAHDNELFNKMLSLHIEAYSKEPGKKAINERFSLLLEHIRYLKKKGVNVVFFEMPINDNLIQLPLAKIIKSKFYYYFPKENFQYIELPNGANYVTSDGVHLTPEEAIEYTLYFKKQVNSLHTIL